MFSRSRNVSSESTTPEFIEYDRNILVRRDISIVDMYLFCWRYLRVHKEHLLFFYYFLFLHYIFRISITIDKMQIFLKNANVSEILAFRNSEYRVWKI